MVTNDLSQYDNTKGILLSQKSNEAIKLIKTKLRKHTETWLLNFILTKIKLMMQNKYFRKFKKHIQCCQIQMKEHGMIITNNKF